MKPGLIASLIVALLVITGLFVFAASDNTKEETTSSTSPTVAEAEASANNTDTEAVNHTSDEVAQHDSEQDCWTIIDGQVYDITSYIPRHPGGDEILRACGTDGTSLFISRQTQEGAPVGSGTAHSNNANSQLSELYIGELSD